MIEKIAKIGLGCALLYYAVLRGARGLVIKVQSWSFRNIDLDAQTVSLNINMLIKNPLLVGLTIKGVKGDVYMQGLKVGYVNTTFNYYLAGGHTHVLPVIVNLGIGDLGQAIWQNIQSGNINTLTVAFDGKVYVGDVNVPVPVQVELDYKSLL